MEIFRGLSGVSEDLRGVLGCFREGLKGALGDFLGSQEEWT